jgi:hypothetical protein
MNTWHRLPPPSVVPALPEQQLHFEEIHEQDQILNARRRYQNHLAQRRLGKSVS